eukprot:641961-Amphidinium_carterae.1
MYVLKSKVSAFTKSSKRFVESHRLGFHWLSVHADCAISWKEWYHQSSVCFNLQGEALLHVPRWPQ